MKKKTYADLFKPQKNTAALIAEEQESAGLSVSENGSGSSLGASCSSGLSTPFGSELGSSGTSGSEEEEFMAELSRQMAECMLDEEEDHADDSHTDTTSVSEGFEVYQLNNQPQESVVGERRVKSNKRVPNTGQNYVNYTRNGQGVSGSGMKAIFLNNYGTSYGSGGTGVFLPRLPNDPTQVKKKPVSSVLMPVRVLQTLELHFNRLNSEKFSRVSRGTSPIGHDTPRTHSGLKDSRDGLLPQQKDDQRLFRSHEANEEEEMQLPQEWTY